MLERLFPVAYNPMSVKTNPWLGEIEALLADIAAWVSGAAPFGAWVPVGEAIGRTKSEKLELHLKVLYELLRDLLVLREGGSEIRNQDIRGELEALAAKVEFSWIRKAVVQADELVEMMRRNIQKTIALDALILALRSA